MSITELKRKFDIFRRTSTISKKNVCWTCILRFFRENNFDGLLALKNGGEVIEFCLRKLMKYDCGDKIILYRILEYCFRFHFHLCVCDGIGHEMEYISAIMKPLRVLRSGDDFSLSKMNLRAYPICTIHVALLLVLSKYGIHIGKSVFNIRNAVITLQYFLQSVQENLGITLSILELSNFAAIILDYLLREESYMLGRGQRYIFLVIRTLEAIKLALNRNITVFNYIRCLEVFYRTIPDPFVSHEDMKGFLRALLEMPPLHPGNLAIITEIYPRYFMPFPTVYSPRSLKHLCRISVRQFLMQNNKLLPHSVRKLHIPRDLHDYLLCIEPLML